MATTVGATARAVPSQPGRRRVIVSAAVVDTWGVATLRKSHVCMMPQPLSR